MNEYSTYEPFGILVLASDDGEWLEDGESQYVDVKFFLPELVQYNGNLVIADNNGYMVIYKPEYEEDRECENCPHVYAAYPFAEILWEGYLAQIPSFLTAFNEKYGSKLEVNA